MKQKHHFLPSIYESVLQEKVALPKKNKNTEINYQKLGNALILGIGITNINKHYPTFKINKTLLHLIKYCKNKKRAIRVHNAAGIGIYVN